MSRLAGAVMAPAADWVLGAPCGVPKRRGEERIYPAGQVVLFISPGAPVTLLTTGKPLGSHAPGRGRAQRDRVRVGREWAIGYWLSTNDL
jgi:hypothetical protein